MLSYNVIWGKVVIWNLEFNISSSGKQRETLGQENIQVISFDIFLMEYRISINGFLMRISNTPPSLSVCSTLTNNVEVSIYISEMSCECILYDCVRGKIWNQVNEHTNIFCDNKNNNKRLWICLDNTVSAVAVMESQVHNVQCDFLHRNLESSV